MVRPLITHERVTDESGVLSVTRNCCSGPITTLDWSLLRDRFIAQLEIVSILPIFKLAWLLLIWALIYKFNICHRSFVVSLISCKAIWTVFEAGLADAIPYEFNIISSFFRLLSLNLIAVWLLFVISWRSYWLLQGNSFGWICWPLSKTNACSLSSLLHGFRWINIS